MEDGSYQSRREEKVAVLSPPRLDALRKMISERDARQAEVAVLGRLAAEKAAFVEELTTRFANEYGIRVDRNYTYDPADQTIYLLSTDERHGGSPETPARLPHRVFPTEEEAREFLAMMQTKDAALAAQRLFLETRAEKAAALQDVIGRMGAEYNLDPARSYRLDPVLRSVYAQYVPPPPELAPTPQEIAAKKAAAAEAERKAREEAAAKAKALRDEAKRLAAEKAMLTAEEEEAEKLRQEALRKVEKELADLDAKEKARAKAEAKEREALAREQAKAAKAKAEAEAKAAKEKARAEKAAAEAQAAEERRRQEAEAKAAKEKARAEKAAAEAQAAEERRRQEAEAKAAKEKARAEKAAAEAKAAEERRRQEAEAKAAKEKARAEKAAAEAQAAEERRRQEAEAKAAKEKARAEKEAFEKKSAAERAAAIEAEKMEIARRVATLMQERGNARAVAARSLENAEEAERALDAAIRAAEKRLDDAPRDEQLASWREAETLRIADLKKQRKEARANAKAARAALSDAEDSLFRVEKDARKAYFDELRSQGKEPLTESRGFLGLF